MTATKSTRNLKRVKPDKPRPDWPLTPSPNGHWVKKIRGKVYNFGRWENADEALKRYLEEKDFIYAYGCRPVDDGGIRLDQAVKLFLDRQKLRRDGELGKPLSIRHFEDQKQTCLSILKTFSKSRSVTTLRPKDFEKLYLVISKTKAGTKAAPSSIKRSIANVKTLFNWLAKENHIPHRLNFGADFVPPISQTAQDELEGTGETFEPSEVWQLIDAAPTNAKAMIWLALNAGCNNADCANLTIKAIDLKAKTLTWKRWKVRNKQSAKVRVLPLWPETVKALRTALRERTEPKSDSHKDLFFVTNRGQQWGQWALTQEISKLKTKLKIDRPGVGFNSFRKVIETFGGTDQAAIDWIMGHIDATIAKHYRTGIPEDRIEAVLNNVWSWLGSRPK